MKRSPIVYGFTTLVLCAGLVSCGPGEPESPRVTFASDVEECAARLREIHRGLVALKTERGWQPSAEDALPGVLIDRGFWTDPAMITCPGGAYAGRDLERFPLASFPTHGGEVLAACANDGAQNHAGGEVNALFADGSVRTLVPAQEVEEGRLPEGTTAIPVGPGSPLEDLAKLKLAR